MLSNNNPQTSDIFTAPFITHKDAKLGLVTLGQITCTFSPLAAAIHGNVPPCEPPVNAILSLLALLLRSALTKLTKSNISCASVMLKRLTVPDDKPCPLTEIANV